MLLTVVVAALAAVPAVVGQDVTYTTTDCVTKYGYTALPSSGTGAVKTWTSFTVITNNFNVIQTSRETVVITPSGTTVTDVITTTATVLTTTTSTPMATTIPTPAGFIPLLYLTAQATPTAMSRVKRHEIEAGDANHALALFKRQTKMNYTNGIFVDRNGMTSDARKMFPWRIFCTVATVINSTTTSTVIADPETVYVPGPTAIATSTTTVSVTDTVTEILPVSTIYEACQGNNVVNQIPGIFGEPLAFDRVIFRPDEGFPVENELVVNTTTGQDCCISCQTTAFCAGSIFAPSTGRCHLRLTEAAHPMVQPMPSASPAPYAWNNNTVESGDRIGYYNPHHNGSHGINGTSHMYNSTEHNDTAVYRRAANSTGYYPTAVAIVATGTVGLMVPTTTATKPNTCPSGSLSLYLGTIMGQDDFPEDIALVMSNGPCGRMSVWPVPVHEGLNPPDSTKRLARI